MVVARLLKIGKRMSNKPYVENVTESFGGQIISSDVTPATEKDVREAQTLHGQGNCPHNIVTDEAGYMYDTRTCFVCGKFLGLI